MSVLLGTVFYMFPSSLNQLNGSLTYIEPDLWSENALFRFSRLNYSYFTFSIFRVTKRLMDETKLIKGISHLSSVSSKCSDPVLSNPSSPVWLAGSAIGSITTYKSWVRTLVALG